MTDLHELPEAEFWAEVDAAWLLEQFRRSEIAEVRERKAIIQSHGMDWPAFVAFFAQAAAQYAAYVAEVGRSLRQLQVGITQRELQAMVDEMTDPPTRRAQAQTQQHTLRMAFTQQARPTRNTRPQQRHYRRQHR